MVGCAMMADVDWVSWIPPLSHFRQAIYHSQNVSGVESVRGGGKHSHPYLNISLVPVGKCDFLFNLLLVCGGDFPSYRIQ